MSTARRLCSCSLVSLATLFVPALLLAEDKPPETVTVAKKPLKVEVKFSGVIEARRMVEIAVRPKSWTQLVVADVAPAGSKVAKGQPILRFETDKIDDQIRDLESARSLTLLAIQQSQEQVRLLSQSTPLDLELAERSDRIAAEDLARYLEIDGPLAKRAADFSLRMSEQNLEYNLEELRQLEKMYKADDLTEETEEIILKRARNDVDYAKFGVESARIAHEEALKVKLPREMQDKRNAARVAALALDKARTTLPLALAKEKLELEKQQQELKKADEHLAKLKGDREMLVVAAPSDGVIYYGRCVQGKWTGVADATAKLRPGGAIDPNEALLTLVDPTALQARVIVPEKELALATVGVKGQLTPTAFPKGRLPVALRARSPIPVSEGNFDAIFDLPAAGTSQLVAGMGCEVRITPYMNAAALVLPVKSVFTDELNDDQRYVLLLGADGKPVRKNVTIGQTNDEVVEITAGLIAGDKVLAEKPKE